MFPRVVVVLSTMQCFSISFYCVNILVYYFIYQKLVIKSDNVSVRLSNQSSANTLAELHEAIISIGFEVPTRNFYEIMIYSVVLTKLNLTVSIELVGRSLIQLPAPMC